MFLRTCTYTEVKHLSGKGGPKPCFSYENSEYRVQAFFQKQTVGAKVHRRKGNSPNWQPRLQRSIEVYLRKWFLHDNQQVGLEAAILSRKRSSSLIEESCAKNVKELMIYTEVPVFFFFYVRCLIYLFHASGKRKKSSRPLCLSVKKDWEIFWRIQR